MKASFFILIKTLKNGEGVYSWKLHVLRKKNATKDFTYDYMILLRITYKGL